ncbi:MAG: YihY/virulence factor BrkB family protein [Actinomycetota bacterium]|nr:YihY/virulence factor BrkB family protein [Actinomycetota bacterium]
MGRKIARHGRELLDRIDSWQSSHPVVSFPVAVFKKFQDDRAGSLAALIAYYGFFSLFPLMLAFVTITTFVIRGNENLQTRLLDSALSQFPIVGSRVGDNIHALKGSVVALVLGLGGALWSGMAVVGAFRDAMDEIWNVPRRARTSFFPRLGRGILTLLALGIAIVISAFLTGLGTSSFAGVPLRIASLAAAVVVDCALFAAAFRLSTSARVGWGEVIPGSIVATIAWMSLQSAGAYLVDRQIRGATEVYGFFAIVIGLLSWIFLAAQLILTAAEVNVVVARRLWPRRMFPSPSAGADHPARIEYSFPFALASVSEGRKVAVRDLSRRLDQRTLKDVELLVSELVTNALRHGQPRADGTIGLVLEVADNRVRVVVEDSGKHFHWERASPGEERLGGYGLQLVDSLATAWGYSEDGTKAVWFEILA